MTKRRGWEAFESTDGKLVYYAPHDLVTLQVESSNRSNFCSGMSRCRPKSATLVASRKSRASLMTALASSRNDRHRRRQIPGVATSRDRSPRRSFRRHSPSARQSTQSADDTSQIAVWSQRDTGGKQVATGLRRLDAIGPTARPALAVKTFSHAGWKFANSR